uniref:exodeoxyribonuclease V subunit gamma n=1 Tax=Thaumasiovibrio occultus TaxID=1891184 RepID=UPI000B34B1E1|nr:exodeoxyribonuclease V subunit gamma [Thaumasiovibrio occultus]
MFTVYHSNQLDILKSLLVELIRRDPLSHPLQAEQILVQSPGMSQWLKMAMAQEQGIAANVSFPLPATFIWQLFIDVLDGVPQRSAFNKEAMVWKLTTLLPELIEHPDFLPLANYLSDDVDGLRTYQLAGKIADIFDQYLVYRPDWIAAWEKGETVPEHNDLHPWQPIFWRALVAKTAELGQSPYHRANLYDKFIDALAQPQAASRLTHLPKRLFVFGISALPPRYIDALQALGEHIDVHLMFTNPCRHYWGDIRDQRFLDSLARRLRRQLIWRGDHSEESTAVATDVNDLQHSVGNSLLASMGKLGRDNLCLLAEREALDIDAFVDIERRGLLQQIQADILDLEDRRVDAIYPDSQHKVALDGSERSLQVHACHSPMREVEVLHDNLLAMFDANPELNPRDVVVMVSDINAYSPAIQAVFGNASGPRYIPFAISDRTADTENPILLAFHHLLKLPLLRCSASELLALLEVPAILRKVELSHDELNQVSRWLQACGVRWGLDEHTARSFALPSHRANTWLFGLQRMLLGYAMPSAMGMYQDQLSFDEVQGLNAEIAGKLGLFIDQLMWAREHLSQAHPALEWQALLNQLLTRLFDFEADEERIATFIRDKTAHLVEQLNDAAVEREISHTILMSYFRQALNNERVSQRFLAGPINFCTLMPMRSIPFKVVCLLGMNDGSYPRNVSPEGFDLMRLSSRRGDRSRRDDDRYLFLEALLSAEHTLYISYIGRSVQDNSERMPSILVSELLEYCEAGYCLAGDQSLSPQSSAERLRKALVVHHSLTPYSAAAFSGNAPSYMQEWLPAAQVHPQTQASTALEVLDPAEPSTEVLTLPELLRFWRLPVQYFFNRRLKVRFDDAQSPLQDDEPFSITLLERYQLRDALLQWVIESGDAEPSLAQFQQRQRASGNLPHVAFGQLALDDTENDIIPLGERIRAFCAEALPDVEVRLTGLEGWLKQVFTTGMVRYRSGDWRSVDLLSSWMEHLCLNAMGHELPTRLFTLDAVLYFRPMAVDDAKTALQPLLDMVSQGLDAPLCYFPKTALAGLQKPEQALQKMQERFESGFHPGEGANSYIQRVWPQWDESLADDVLQLAQRYLLPAFEWVEIEKVK